MSESEIIPWCVFALLTLWLRYVFHKGQGEFEW